MKYSPYELAGALALLLFTCFTLTQQIVIYSDVGGVYSSDGAAAVSAVSAADSKSPSKPDDLTVKAIPSVGVSISWKASKDNVAVTGYRIYKSASTSDSKSMAYLASINDVSYIDAAVMPDTKYYYRVSAYDAAGNESTKSGDKSVKAPAIIASASSLPKAVELVLPETHQQNIAPVLAPGVRVVLTTPITHYSATDGVESIMIPVGAQGTIMGNSSMGGGNVNWPVNFDGDGDFNSTCVSTDCNGVYDITYANYNDNSGHFPLVAESYISSGVALDTQPPSVPANLRAISYSPWNVSLSWSPSTDNVGLRGYRVLRSDNPIQPARLLTLGTTDTSYSDNGLSPATTYRYLVYAYDIQNNGSATAEVTVTTVSPPSTGDRTPPTITISTPAHGSTTTGLVTLRATSSDNVGVTGVIYKIDGKTVGTGNTTVPHLYTWNSATVNNGARALVAVASDAAGNLASSSPVVLIVSNLDPAKKPWQNFNLSKWKLQLTGTTTLDVRPSDYDTYATQIAPRFFSDPVDGSMTFWLDSFKTPASSTYHRTELREVIDGSSDNTNWTIGTGKSHILKANIKLAQLPATPDQVTVLQIHPKNTPDIDPLLRVAVMSKSTVRAYYKTDSTGNVTQGITCRNSLGNNIVVGFNWFDAEVRVIGTTLSLYINNDLCFSHSLLDGNNNLYWLYQNYFKAGNYSQAYRGIGQVQFKKLEATHQ